jgi:hypothetical protein
MTLMNKEYGALGCTEEEERERGRRREGDGGKQGSAYRRLYI